MKGIAVVISLLAILLAPILLIRFRKGWVAAFNVAVYEPDHDPIRRPIARLRHAHARRSKVRQALPDASDRFSSDGGIPYRAHLWAGERVGQECASCWGMRA